LQKEHLNRIEEAKEYARRAISDPVLNDFYAAKAARKKGIGAWHMAIKDFYYPPKILDADFRDFTGRCGDTVRFTAHDKFKVVSTRVIFATAAGIVLEEGDGDESYVFRTYVLKKDIELMPGDTVTFHATDLPGNLASVELTWPFNCREVIKFENKVQGRTKRTKSQLRIREK
jgi:plastocyanin